MLITDDLISFYTFFTVICAEISYLWAYTQIQNIIPITIILLGYIVTVLLFAFLKGISEGTKCEKIVSTLYVTTFLLLFVVGCFFNWTTMTLSTVILLATTALWIKIREVQDTAHAMCIGKPTIDYLINCTFRFVWIISQIVVVGGPFVLFVIFLANISSLPLCLKIVFPIIYIILAPFFAYYEDSSATCNIFELGYDITYRYDK